METKKCPFCAEEIKIEAKKCRFCGSNLINKKDLSFDNYKKWLSIDYPHFHIYNEDIENRELTIYKKYKTFHWFVFFILLTLFILPGIIYLIVSLQEKELKVIVYFNEKGQVIELSNSHNYLIEQFNNKYFKGKKIEGLKVISSEVSKSTINIVFGLGFFFFFFFFINSIVIISDGKLLYGFFQMLFSLLFLKNVYYKIKILVNKKIRKNMKYFSKIYVYFIIFYGLCLMLFN